MIRLAGWLAIVAMALTSHIVGNPLLQAACVPALLLLLGIGAPAPVRPGVFALAAAAMLAIAAGFDRELLDLMPTLIAALIGGLFARTLRRGRAPLIARAIVAIDGPQPLTDPLVAGYARRLTALWAAYQFALAAIALLLALRQWFAPALLGAVPGPRGFGLVVLPAAVAVLAVGELLLRPVLLPQAPRRSPLAFFAALARAWPAILNE